MVAEVAEQEHKTPDPSWHLSATAPFLSSLSLGFFLHEKN